jgi:hypothetical protein
MGIFEFSLYKPIMMFVLFSAILLFSQSSLNYAVAQGNNLWYVGDGAKKGMYVTYRIQDQDTNAGRPFDMTIYFKDHNNTGMYWIAPTFVVDEGRVINGTLHLSDLDSTALNSQIPKEMNEYRSGYSNSLKWLSAFVSKPGQSLTAPYWGKIASIGGSPISPSGKATITTPAGTFNTTVITWHKGVDNNIWIKDGFPYPVKAQTYADITTGNPPTQFAFELLATGQGQPKQPVSKEEIPKPPQERRTERGTYIISLTWDPITIKTGNNTKFGIIFYDDKKQNIVTDVGYNFAVLDSTQQLIYGKDNQLAPDGTAVQNVIFQKPGPATVKVLITQAGSGATSNFVETGNFDIVVQ